VHSENSGIEDGDDEDEINLRQFSEESGPKVEPVYVNDWQVTDEYGDCSFCYRCLDANGQKIYVCDSKFCKYAVHLKCCRELDAELNINTTLFPGTNKEWQCHYCQGYDEAFGLWGNPINEFTKFIQNKMKSDKQNKPVASKASSRSKVTGAGSNKDSSVSKLSEPVKATPPKKTKSKKQVEDEEATVPRRKRKSSSMKQDEDKQQRKRQKQ
jgi:hypothetical protein